MTHRRRYPRRFGPAATSAVLGIVDGLHDAGAALVRGGRILVAANEERFTRRKLQGGWPSRSIRAVLDATGRTAQDIVAVAIGGVATPTLPTRWVRPLQDLYARSLGICFDRPWHPVDRMGDLVRYRLGWTRHRATARPGRLLFQAIERRLSPALRGKPIAVFDHHHCHAATAAYTAGPGRWLVVTADAHGDGRCWTVHERTEDGTLVPHHELGVGASLGAFYSYVTATLGFRPGRHEGKVLGLAASGHADQVPRPFPFRWIGSRLVYEGRWGLRGMRDLRPLRELPRADVAAWVQQGTQSLVLEAITHWLEATGARSLALAGGVFANVAINGALARLPSVDALHVFPHMGDGGLGAGAALLHDRALAPPADRNRHELLSRSDLGTEIDAHSADLALRRAGLPRTRPRDPDAALVRELAAGRPVARVVGPMEFGPRALGQRSVLAPARTRAIVAPLNDALARDAFMPFAPLVSAEQATACFDGVASCAQALRFMTVALPAKPYFHAACPAAVHVDGTARPQVVVAEERPDLHRLLTQYREATGLPGLINTSFNRHEEPIVASAAHAVDAFLSSGLSAIRLGPYVVHHPAPRPWPAS